MTCGRVFFHSGARRGATSSFACAVAPMTSTIAVIADPRRRSRSCRSGRSIAFALVILVAVARRLRPVRPITVFFLALLTGAWIWANLRASGWQEECGGEIPEGLDPVTKAMFYRGWSLAPFMFVITYFNRLHPGGLEGLVLVFDWLVLIAALSLARFVCDRCVGDVDP
jgi:hypothetical protein